MFNLPKEIVVFDTEYTTWEGAMERGWGGPNEHKEIVQIGAVKVETENFEELDSFSVYVKPKINPELSEYFTELTGITQEEIDGKDVDFQTAMKRFAKWADNLPLYSWRGGDDDVMKKNSELIGVPFPFKESRFGDISSVFEAHGVSTENYLSSTIVEAFGKKKTRRGHNALGDAQTIVDGLKELKKQKT